MSTYRALLVEDDPVSAEFLAQLLRSLGLEVVQAARVEEARALLANRAGGFTLALVDQNIAGERGETLLQAPGRPPMLAISAELPDSEDLRLRAAGFAACLRKPLDAVALARALRGMGLVIPVWDERRGLEVAAGDPAILAGLRGLLRRDLPQRRSTLLNALECADQATARTELHTLLGSCRLTGAVRLELAVQSLASALDEGDWRVAWQELEAAMEACG
jgi:CheY-like chemotaxis protein